VKNFIPLIVIPSIVTGGFGFAVGCLTSGITLFRDRSAARQTVMEFLMHRRQELDSNANLLTVVGLLKQELEAKRKNQSPPTLPEDFDARKLRDLPAFLEPVGTFLEYNPATFRKAYGFFSEEVLLCGESSLLWEGETRYDSSVYWRSFSRFVTATRNHGYTTL
jgi:hypothetical protein